MEFPLEISQYKLGSIIGRGATSEVYVATCLANQQVLAIKVINLEVCPIEIENLRAEVAFWSSCHHPNVVEYYGSFIDKSSLYILMEYMSGGSCFEIMRYLCPKGFAKETYIATILREVLKSLEYFHENRQMHRDVKAGNILINEKGEVKIADFGIAANLLEQGQRKRARFTVIGTPCYMAPEILAAGVGYTEKADIWSLGITAIELATGSAPYANLYPLEVIVRISNSPPPTLPEDDHNFTSAFKDFVKQCLQSVPSKRATAKALLDTKFIKTASPIAEIAKVIIGKLEPLEERFRKVHTEKAAAKKEEAPKADNKIAWDFFVEDDNKSSNNNNASTNNNNNNNGDEDDEGNKEQSISSSSSNEQISEKPKVLKKGKFTITKSSNSLPINGDEGEKNEIKIKAMEGEVDALKSRIHSIKTQNKELKKNIKHLKKEVKTLTPSD